MSSTTRERLGRSIFGEEEHRAGMMPELPVVEPEGCLMFEVIRPMNEGLMPSKDFLGFMTAIIGGVGYGKPCEEITELMAGRPPIKHIIASQRPATKGEWSTAEVELLDEVEFPRVTRPMLGNNVAKVVMHKNPKAGNRRPLSATMMYNMGTHHLVENRKDDLSSVPLVVLWYEQKMDGKPGGEYIRYESQVKRLERR